MAAPASVTLIKSAGRLKDGDEVMVLKVPELEGKYRFEKMIFRVNNAGQPIMVIRIAPDNGSGGPGAYGEEMIKENEYWGNHGNYANYDAAPFVKKLVDSKIFAAGASLTGSYSPNSRFPLSPTSQETDYVIDGDGVITKSPKPASSADVKDGQDKQNALLGQIAQGLTGGTSTSTTGAATTTTQKLVRVLLIATGVGLVIWGATKLLGKKKK